MRRKFLEGLGLEKEAIDSILDQNSEEIGALKKEVETLKSEKEVLQSDIKSKDEEVKELKKGDKNVSELETEIETLKAEKESLAKARETEKFDEAIYKAVSDAKYPDLMIGKFERDKLKLEADGSVSGIDEQSASLREKYADQFNPNKTGSTPATGNNNKKEQVTKEEFNKMSYLQRVSFKKENKELYDQLKGE